MEEYASWGYSVESAGEDVVFRSKEGDFAVRSEAAFYGMGRFSVDALRRLSAKGLVAYVSTKRGSAVLLPRERSPYEIQRAQILLYLDEGRRREVAASIIRASSLNKLWLLELLEIPKREREEARSAIQDLLSQLDEAGEDLLGYEANIARVYYEKLKLVVPEEYGFEARTRRPPKDPVSACISFGNMMLYRLLRDLLMRHGLDPRIGNLHKPFRARPSLALDIAEEFRQPVVEAAVAALFTSKSFAEGKHFEKRRGEVLLTKRGVSLLRKVLNHRLSSSISYGVSLVEQMHQQVHSYLSFVLGKSSYKPFTTASPQHPQPA